MRIFVTTLALASACSSTHPLADGAVPVDGAHADGAPGAADAPAGGVTGPFVYFAGLYGGLAGFHVDRASGALTALPGTWPITAGASLAVAARPDGKFLYTADDTNGVMVTWAIDATTGALTAAGTVPSGATTTDYIAMDPKGRVLWVSDFANGLLITFSIDAATGALTSIGTVDTGDSSRGLAVDAQARVLAVMHGTDPGSITMSTLDATTGLPTLVDADPATPGRQDLASARKMVSATFDATGTRLYATSIGDNTLGFYTVAPTTGQAALVAAPTVEAIPEAVAAAPDGAHLYVATVDGMQVVALAGDGTPTPGALDGDVAGLQAVAIDPTGAFALGASSSSLTTYAIDGTTGALTTGPSTSDNTMDGAFALVGF